MSYLSTALTRISERRNLRQAEIVRIADFTRSHMSRLFSGEQSTISNDDFARLLTAFRDPGDQAELTVARCMDARVGPAAHLVEITVRGRSTGPAAGELPEVQLSREAERAFAWLRGQCPVNPDVERHLIGFARLTGMK